MKVYGMSQTERFTGNGTTIHLSARLSSAQADERDWLSVFLDRNSRLKSRVWARAGPEASSITRCNLATCTVRANIRACVG
ncbi:hypothetical protein Baya_12648 [Bagarius yarrelli]|uniref:Uncharacterized protein n=1 Tax=Bagarius yarrelli TaxID=175774 RepID=A0A556V441_BAGYA|nr:hypothetical protein Baya_12648 [Bagarius yarrelli]